MKFHLLYWAALVLVGLLAWKTGVKSGKKNRDVDVLTHDLVEESRSARSEGLSEALVGVPRLTMSGEEIARQLNYSTKHGTRRQTVVQLFTEASHVASAGGDFEPLGLLFEIISQEERVAMLGHLGSVFSKLGPEHDMREKNRILAGINADASVLEHHRRRILEQEARERYADLKDRGIIEELAPEDFSAICVSMARSGLAKGFEILADGGDEDTRRIAASRVARYALSAGTLEASEELAKLPPGPIRDEAVAELVIWLAETGSENEAIPWLGTIKDEPARIRASAGLRPRASRPTSIED